MRGGSMRGRRAPSCGSATVQGGRAAGPCGGSSGGLVVSMADVTRRHEEDDVLGDVRGVIADALEVPRDEQQLDGRLDGARVVRHPFDERGEHPAGQRVELVVAAEYAAGERFVASHERI